MDSNKSDNKILVSILTATYNQESYIAQCLQSLVDQETTFDYEILVHDDASTDNTASIIKTFESKYPHLIKAIYQKENLYSKQNDAIAKIQNKRIKGKYIAFCEGDDYWTTPDKLQKQIDFLEQNPLYSMVYSGVEVADKNNNIIRTINHKKPTKNLLEYLVLHKNPVNTPSVIIKSDVFKEAIQVCEEIPFKLMMRDYIYWLIASKKGEVKYFKETTAGYRILEESASHSKDIKKLIAFAKNARDIKLHFYKKYKIKGNENKIHKRFEKEVLRLLKKREPKSFLPYYKLFMKENRSFLFNFKAHQYMLELLFKFKL